MTKKRIPFYVGSAVWVDFSSHWDSSVPRHVKGTIEKIDGGVFHVILNERIDGAFSGTTFGGVKVREELLKHRKA